MGNGRMDVGEREAVYIRQTDAGEYEIGLERPRSDVAAIEVSANGIPLTDEESSSSHASRLAIRSSLFGLGPTTFEVRLFDDAGQDLRGYERELITR
jgi:hypothetical protein